MILNTSFANVQDSNGPDAQSARLNRISNFKAGSFKMTFKIKIDGTSQPLAIKVPEGYSPDKKWPLLVTLHGLGDGPIIVSGIDSMVQIGPYGRGDTGFKNIGEKDVFECIELASGLFSLDPNRIYLCGFSMGAEGVFRLGLNYPDKWAACVPVCGGMKAKDLYLIENAYNLPFWINAGSKDELVPPETLKSLYSKSVSLGYNHWQYQEYENNGHSFNIDWEKVEKWLLTHERNPKPSKIIYNCSDSGKAYWLEIISVKNEKEKTRIETEITGQKIRINSYNVSDYILHLDSAPISLSEDIVIIENEEEIYNGRMIDKKIFQKSMNTDNAG